MGVRNRGSRQESSETGDEDNSVEEDTEDGERK